MLEYEWNCVCVCGGGGVCVVFMHGEKCWYTRGFCFHRSCESTLEHTRGSKGNVMNVSPETFTHWTQTQQAVTLLASSCYLADKKIKLKCLRYRGEKKMNSLQKKNKTFRLQSQSQNQTVPLRFSAGATEWYQLMCDVKASELQCQTAETLQTSVQECVGIRRRFNSSAGFWKRLKMQNAVCLSWMRRKM